MPFQNVYFQNRYVHSDTFAHARYLLLISVATRKSILNHLSAFCRSLKTKSVTKESASLTKMTNDSKSPLHFEIFHECQTTKARTGRMTLVHHHVDTPVFMPVGTQVSSNNQVTI